MYLVDDRSWTLTLPAPAPPPTCAEPEFDRPQLQARTSISPACVLSTDSPLRLAILMNMSKDIFMLLVTIPATGAGIRPCWDYAPKGSGRLARRQLGNQTQGDAHPFELVMRLEEELGGVVARVAFHFLDDHLGRRQRLLGLDQLAGALRVGDHVVADPVAQETLHRLRAGERAHLVAHHALQVVGEAARGEQVGQARGQVGVGGGVRIIVFGGLLQRLRADEGGEIAVLAMHQRHEAVLGQLGLAAVADGDLGRALHVHAAVVGRERVHRQVGHGAAGLDAADRGAPAVQLERAGDVGGHRVGRVGPHVAVVVGALDLLLEVERVDRVGLRAVRQAGEKARHGQADVARVVRVAQRAPGGVFAVLEDLGQVARVRQLAPRIHLQRRRRGAGDERGVRGSGDLGHLAQQLDVDRAVVEVVVAHQAAVRVAAELAELLLVDLLEDRALVPGGALVALERLVQLALGDVHHPNLEHLVGLGVVDEMVQAAPGAFELGEVGVVQDQVDLLGQLLVQRGDQGLDRVVDVAGHQRGVGQRLLRQRVHGVLDRGLGLVGLGLEFLLQQRGEVVELGHRAGGAGRFLLRGHRWTPGISGRVGGKRARGAYSAGASVGFGAAASDFSSSGFFSTLPSSSSAPTLPSMYVSRSFSWVRASSRLFSAPTFLATASGEKSAMLSNVMSTLRLPSPVSVLGTANATRGFIDFRRSSKLSTSISRNLRSATGASGSAGLPDRSAITPMTNGICIFLFEPYSSTSYSIWTRGARLRAMNFWLLPDMTVLSWKYRSTPSGVGFRLFEGDASQHLDAVARVGHQFLDDRVEIHLKELHGAVDEHRSRAAVLCLAQESRDLLQDSHRIRTGRQAARTGGFPRSGSGAP